MMNSDKEIIIKMLKSVGRKVSFKYPGDEGQKRGVPKERVIIPGDERAGVSYWDVVDLIHFPDESEPNWIRIGYYRKTKNRLVWASQTTITEPIAIWRSILHQAARDKPWFRQLLEDVIKELRREEGKRENG